MILKSLLSNNIKKYGPGKVLLGFILVYPGASSLFIFENLIFLKILNKILFLFNIQPLNRKDFISYGRINLNDYNWFDRWNCHLCAYVNGTNHIVSETLEVIGKCDINTLDSFQKIRLLQITSKAKFWLKPFMLFDGFAVYIIKKIFKYKHLELKEISNDLKKIDYAENLKSEEFKTIHKDLRHIRGVFKAVQYTLSIIENDWCPLTYINKKYLLEHQKNWK
jgi:hypothetical protein